MCSLTVLSYIRSVGAHKDLKAADHVATSTILEEVSISAFASENRTHGPKAPVGFGIKVVR